MSIHSLHADAATIEGVKPKSKIDFELDLEGFTSVSLLSYAGLNWRSAAVADGYRLFGEDAPESGYITGITSGKQVVFDAGGRSMGFSASGSFDFKSVQMTAAWSQDLTVKITGYRDGEKMYSTTIHVTDDAPTLVKLNWKGVDQVEMKPSHAVIDPDQPYTGNHFVMDDLVIANLVSPAPVERALDRAFAADTVAPADEAFAFAGSQHAIAQVTALV